MITLPTIFVTIAQAATPVAPSTPGAPGAPGAPAPSLIGGLLPFLLIAVIFYFLIIRPQQKRFKDHQKLVSSLKTGDQVVMSQGIHGIVSSVKDATVVVKVADNVKIEFDKAAVTRISKPA